MTGGCELHNVSSLILKLIIMEDQCSKSSIMERTRTLPQIKMGKQ